MLVSSSLHFAASMLAQSPPTGQQEACGPRDSASAVCRGVFEATGNSFLAQASDTFVVRPAKIAMILVGALVAQRLLRRAITRMGSAMQGGRDHPQSHRSADRRPHDQALRDVNGTVWYVPNGTIDRVGNTSQQWSRAVLDVAVAYDTDIPRAISVTKQAADELWTERIEDGTFLEEPEVWGIEDLGADGVALRLVVKTAPDSKMPVIRELRARVKAAFDRAGIEIPYPQRTVHFTGPGVDAAAAERGTDSLAEQAIELTPDDAVALAG